MADRSNEGQKSNRKSSDDPRAPYGRGMTSPDSTQAPLSAETGEPDEEAMRGRSGQRGNEGSSDRSSGRSSGRSGSDSASDSSNRNR